MYEYVRLFLYALSRTYSIEGLSVFITLDYYCITVPLGLLSGLPVCHGRAPQVCYGVPACV